MVSEDHSLDRHVSQRGHRTDGSREKPGKPRRAGRERARLQRRRQAPGEREAEQEGGGGRVLRGLRE